MACSFAMSQTVEIVSNLRPIIFGLKVRTRGPQPSICVRTFSLFTTCVVIWHIVSFGQKYTDRPIEQLASFKLVAKLLLVNTGFP